VFLVRNFDPVFGKSDLRVWNSVPTCVCHPFAYGLVGVGWGSNPVENASNRGKTDSDCIVLG